MGVGLRNPHTLALLGSKDGTTLTLALTSPEQSLAVERWWVASYEEACDVLYLIRKNGMITHERYLEAKTEIRAAAPRLRHMISV